MVGLPSSDPLLAALGSKTHSRDWLVNGSLVFRPPAIAEALRGQSCRR